MTVLPIVDRELRVAARRGTTHWARFALTTVVALVTVNQFIGSSNPGSTGRSAFLWLLSAAFVLACAACALTADALSAEQREGTLGLLFLTDLHSWDITLGKLTSAGLGATYAGIAFAPLLMLPLLAGGVSGAEAARTGLALLGILLYSLASGLAASARETEKVRAITKAAIQVLMTVILPLFAAWPGLLAPLSLIALLSPLTTIRLAQDSSYQAAPAQFWASLALQLLLAALLLLRAGIRLRHNLVESVIRKPPPDEPEPYSVEAASNVSHAIANPERPPTPRRFEDARPLVWLIKRQRGQSAICWIAAVVLLLSSQSASMLLQGVGVFRATGGSLPIGWFLLYQAWWVGDALLAWAACRFFFEARRSGEMELLLGTPLGARALIQSHGIAMRQLLFWPILAVFIPLLLAGGCSTALALLRAPLGRMGGFQLYSGLYGLVRPVELVLTVVALNWLGMFFGLISRRLISAVTLTLGLVVGFPMMVHLLFHIAVRPLIMPRMAFTNWLYLSLAYYPLNCLFLVALALWARRQLYRAPLSEPVPPRWFSRWSVVRQK